MDDLYRHGANAALLFALSEDVSVTGTTGWTAAVTATIPAAFFVGGGLLQLHAYNEHTSNANAKILRVRLGGQSVYGRSVANASCSRVGGDVFVAANGRAVGTNWLGAETNGLSAAAQVVAAGVIDWTAPLLVELGWEPTAAGDVFTVRGCVLLGYARAPR